MALSTLKVAFHSPKPYRWSMRSPRNVPSRPHDVGMSHVVVWKCSLHVHLEAVPASLPAHLALTALPA